MANDILARLTVLIDGQTAQFGAALKNLEGQFNKFGQSVTAQSSVISKFEKTIAGVQRSLGSLGLAFGAFQVGAILKDAVESIIEFEKQLSTVKAITGATGAEFEALKNDALRLGAATQFTSTEVAKLQTEFGRLGFTTNEILAATEATIQLSIATGEDLAKAADVAGSTVRAFQLSATETQRVVDVMAESFNKSALGLDNFSESMKYVAPIAAAANISVEETTALLATLADAGIRGSTAGTSLRKIITDLAKDARPLSERLAELSAKGLTLTDAFDEVGRTAQTSLLVLSKNTDKTAELTKNFEAAEGAGKRAADIMQDNLAGSITKLSSAYDGLIQGQGAITESLRLFVDAMTNVINLINGPATSAFSDYIKLVLVVPRTLARVINAISEYTGATEDAARKSEELAQKTRAIESTVQAAFNSGNIEAYILALDNNIYKEEIIAEIRARQAKEILGQSEAITEQTGLVSALEKRIKDLGEAIKNATSVDQIRVLQRELEGTKLKLDALLNPSNKPQPIIIPVSFDTDINVAELEASIKRINEQANIKIDPIDIEVDQEDTSFSDALANKLGEALERINEFREAFSSLMSDAVGGTLEAFAEDLGNVAAGVGNFGDNIIKAVAGFAKQFGRLLIAAGLGKIAFDKLKFSGVGAVAAGVALIAAAQAVSAHLSGSSSATGGGSSSSSGGNVSTPQRLNESSGQSVRVEFGTAEFKFNGRELEASLKAKQQLNGIIGG